MTRLGRELAVSLRFIIYALQDTQPASSQRRRSRGSTCPAPGHTAFASGLLLVRGSIGCRRGLKRTYLDFQLLQLFASSFSGKAFLSRLSLIPCHITRSF